MRPRRLEVDGFSTFRERTVLDFDGLDLVAFTGATGAGKSTLIDAITFALYGSVARYDNASRVAPVIHQLSNQARVRLDFEAGGRTYPAPGVVGRGGRGATTAEARLEVADGDGQTTVLAGEVGELNDAVEQLLGLDFKQFTRTIVLPQGEFAAFLRDDPANRDKLLQRLLDLGVYERMGQLARARAKKSANQIEILAEQRRASAPPTDEELADLGRRVELVEAVRSTVEQALDELATLDAALDPLRARVTEIDRTAERLAEVEMPAGVADLDDDRVAAEAAVSEAAAALATARTTRDRALVALEAAPDRAELVRAASQIEQLAEARVKIDGLRASAGDADRLVAELTTEQADVDSALSRAEDAVRTARLAADAAGWTAALVVGEPCPVCHREVETIPDHDAAGEAEAAAAEQQRLRAESKTVATRLARAVGGREAAAEEIERQGERIDLLELQLSGFDGDRDLESLASTVETVEALEQAHRAAGAAAAEAEQVAAEAEDRRRRLDQSLAAMRAALSSRRDALADLEPPTLDHRSLLADHELLQSWAAERAESLAAERIELATEGKRMAADRGRLAGTLADAVASVGIDDGAAVGSPGVDPGLVRSRLADALADARTAVATAADRRDRDAELAARIDQLDGDRLLNDALGRHLRSGGFGSWLLAEALDAIVAKATVWLLQLSNDQYSLVAGDKHFAIIDHTNADETRDVRTL
ncbi:MAG: SMC family ATPase, partial [Actinomycetota bacterium]